MRRASFSVRIYSGWLALVSAITLFWAPQVMADQVDDLGWGKSEFCRPGREARDYSRPLTSMAPIRSVPREGKLSFGPKGMRLQARGGRVSVNGGLVGFSLNDVAVQQVRKLNWVVSTRLSVVNAKGQVTDVVDQRRRRIGVIEGNSIRDFLFSIPKAKRFYRTDISFQAIGSGKVLGEFSNYVRAVPAFYDARLLTPGRVVPQGQVLPLRLANFGTETISSRTYDWRLSVEFFDGQSWVQAPSEPAPEKHILRIQKVAAGGMEPCVFIPIASSEAVGLYRASVVVDRSLAGPSDRSVKLSTEFEVSGRGLK